VVDFKGVDVISSSFADEVFGRLYVLLGPLGFGSVFKFQNINREVAALIDRAIIQRSAVSG